MKGLECPESIAQSRSIIKARQNYKPVLRTVKGQCILLSAKYRSCGIRIFKNGYIVHEDLPVTFAFRISVNGKIKAVVIDPCDPYSGVFSIIGVSVIPISGHILGGNRREVTLRPVQPEPGTYGIP